MKVLVVSTGVFDVDGITNVILNYYRATDKNNLFFDFVVPNEIRPEIRAELESNGSNVYQLKGRMKNPIQYVRKLTKLMKSKDFDIVHAHGNSCTLALETYAAKKAGIEVRIPHSHNSTNTYKLAHKMLRGLFDSTYTHGFACGKLAGEWLYNGKSFEIINNAIVTEQFKYDITSREMYRQKYGFKANKVIGHIGHFTYQKNQEYLLEIFKELYKLDSSYRLMLIGDGHLKSKVEKKAVDLEIENAVLFVGKTLEVPKLMQAMDLLVMPSRFEGLPLTLVEAQAASLPCFVSDAISAEAGITNLVTFIPLKKQPKDWADIIHNHPISDRSEISERISKEIVEAGYSISHNAEKVKDLYHSYLQQVKN